MQIEKIKIILFSSFLLGFTFFILSSISYLVDKLPDNKNCLWLINDLNIVCDNGIEYIEIIDLNGKLNKIPRFDLNGNFRNCD